MDKDAQAIPSSGLPVWIPNRMRRSEGRVWWWWYWGCILCLGIFSSAPWIVSHVKVRVTVRHREERVPVRAVGAAVRPAEGARPVTPHAVVLQPEDKEIHLQLVLILIIHSAGTGHVTIIDDYLAHEPVRL